MRLKIILALLTAAGLATAFVGAASASGPRSQAKSGSERFWVASFSVKSGNPTAFVGTGVFTDAGTITGSGAVNTLHLTKGTISVDTSGIKEKFSASRTTCFFTLTITGDVRLTGGTGSYKGISSGPLPVSGKVVGVLPRKSGACNQNGTPIGALAGELSGSGTVTVG